MSQGGAPAGLAGVHSTHFPPLLPDHFDEGDDRADLDDTQLLLGHNVNAVATDPDVRARGARAAAGGQLTQACRRITTRGCPRCWSRSTSTRPRSSPRPSCLTLRPASLCRTCSGWHKFVAARRACARCPDRRSSSRTLQGYAAFVAHHGELRAARPARQAQARFAPFAGPASVLRGAGTSGSRQDEGVSALLAAARQAADPSSPPDPTVASLSGAAVDRAAPDADLSYVFSIVPEVSAPCSLRVGPP